MGRRSSHSADELHELILAAGTELIQEKGYAALSARAIATRIGYSPGTLYNVFEDLDHLVLTIEQRVLDQLAERLARAEPSADPVQHLCNVAHAYLEFTREHPKLWNLLFEHLMPSGWVPPPAFQARIDRLRSIVEGACVPLIGNQDAALLHRTASVTWAALHGITSLATTQKLENVTHENARVLVDDLVRTFALGRMASVANGKRKRK